MSTLFKNCEFALYADDTVLFTANDSFENSVSNMQQDISRLSSWCVSNGISVNTGKTKVMLFGSKTTLDKLPPFEILYEGGPLLKVVSYNYLGLTLDSQLNYNLHVKKLISSVSAKLKQFHRMRSFLNEKAALMVYKNMLLPILEYGDIFLSASSAENRKKLQVLQNKGLRCVFGVDIDSSSSDDLHARAGLLKLKYRREQHMLNFVYDWSLDSTLLVTKSDSMRTTRSSCKTLFKLKKPRTEKFKKSLVYKGKVKWNELPLEFHQSASKAMYKLMIQRHITTKSFKPNLPTQSGNSV